MGVFKGETFHRVGEIDHIGTINNNKGNIGNQENGIQDTLIPSVFAKAKGQDGEQDEKAVGPKYRHGVETESSFNYSPAFFKIADMAQHGFVNHVKNNSQKTHNKENCQQSENQRGDVIPKQAS